MTASVPSRDTASATRTTTRFHPSRLLLTGVMMVVGLSAFLSLLIRQIGYTHSNKTSDISRPNGQPSSALIRNWMEESDLVFTGTVEEIQGQWITCHIKSLFKGESIPVNEENPFIRLIRQENWQGSSQLRVRDTRIFFTRRHQAVVQLMSHLHVTKNLLNQLRNLSSNSALTVQERPPGVKGTKVPTTCIS